MPYQDGIIRKHCFSVSDFHTFDFCSFRFFVTHHLEKRYELGESNYNMALGSLLDETIKLFHQTKAYGQPSSYVKNLIKASCNKMIAKVKSQKSPSFYSSIEKFLDAELCEKATEIFINYYETIGQKVHRSIGEVGFCEWIIETDFNRYKLWGGPDALEMGEDGVPEICDYKFRENIEKGKDNMDMNLMPKIYTLLCCKRLKAMGYTKARFMVRFWQDPGNNDFYEEFDLDEVEECEDPFRERIEKILGATEVNFCEKPFCSACKSPKRDEYLLELQQKFDLQLRVINNDS